ncbi:MAG TPA: YlxR family protein [Candidatus Limnocylindrales bacterium]|nr:YlxR family protein [Candidatus Limnocylindrales bacterium]
MEELSERSEQRRPLPPTLDCARVRREPQRTCLGCRQVRPRALLVRLVRDLEGRVQVDRQGTGVGRGAYVCASAGCLAKGLTKGRLDHAFRRPSTPPVVNVASILTGGTKLVHT